MSHSIDDLVINITSESNGASEKLNALADSIARLIDPTAAAVSNLKALGTALGTINSKISNVPDKLTSVATSIDTLGKSVGTSVGSMQTFTDSIGELANNTKEAKDNMEGLANDTDKLINASEKSNRLANSTGNGLRNIGRFINTTILAGGIAGAISSANDYIEAQNLFRVSMGESYEVAKAWSSKVSKALGIDPAEMEKNMGYFQQLSSAMGIANDKAYILSKNMTSLAYDISSFYNIRVDQSFLKLQSALVGELEPIRRLGMDISKTRLQQELYTLGIRANVDSLTQADKAILRYIALMKQTKNAQADMGKTLMSPANALRVLKSQLIQLARSIGYIFIPILQSIIPILQVVTRLFTNLAERLARFLGYVDFDFSDQSEKAVDDILGIGAAADKAGKKIKYFTTSFDELHVISDNMGGAGEGATLLGDIELPQYDILSKYAGNLINEVLPKLEAAFEQFVQSPVIQVLATLLKTIYDIIKNIAQYLLDNPDILADFLVLETIYLITLGVAGIVTKFAALNKTLATTAIAFGSVKVKLLELLGFVLLLSSAYNVLKYSTVEALTTGDERINASRKTLLNFGLAIAAVGLLFGNVWVVAIGGLVVVVSSFFDEIMLYMATFIHNIDVLVNEKIVAGILKAIAGLAIEITRKLWELGYSITKGVDTFVIGVKRKVLEMAQWITTKLADIIKPTLEVYDMIFKTNYANAFGNIDSWYEKEFAKLDEAEEKWDGLYETKMKYFDDVKDTTMRKIDEAAKLTTQTSAEIQWKAAQKVAEKHNKADENTNFLASVFKDQNSILQEQNTELIGSQELTNELTKTNQQLLKDANVTSLDNLHVAQENLNSLSTTTSTTHNLLERILSRMSDVIRAVKDVSITVINNYGGGEYASGGLPRKGELFLANEAGPEFIGSIGNRSAVANSTQMVEALAGGVYEGMTAAIRNNTSTRPINVPVQVLMPNGRELARATAQGTIDNGFNIGLEGYDV